MAIRLTRAGSCPLIFALMLILGGATVCLSAGHGREGKEIDRALRAQPIPGLKPTLPVPRVREMRVSPHIPMRMYAATRRGLYTSDDGGASWQPLPVAGSNEEVFTLATHPTDPATVLVGRRDGLWQGQDGGQSWIPLPYPTVGPYIPLSVALAPNQPQVMYMATARDGVYKSPDGGYHWKAINQGLPEARAGGRVEEIRTLVAHPLDADIAYVALERHGVYRTTDGGQSWRPFNQGLAFPLLTAAYPPRLTFDPADPKRLYAVFGQRIHSHLVRNRLYVTSGTGEWVPLEVELPSNVFILTVAVDRVKRMLRLWGPDAVWEVPLGGRAR
ncbi:MAG: WD40/YVTN/BNR-like repeat-containing protein [Candidatus Methylomirabilales bacterium]